MEEETEKHLVFNFQWTLGDTRVLEKQLVKLTRKKDIYSLITFLSRLLSLTLVFLTSYILLKPAPFEKIIIIFLSATISLWVSWGLVLFAMRKLEKLAAQDPMTVDWNEIKIDRTGILWSTETTQDYVSWQGITSIISKERSLWFKTGAAHGYFIPSRVFETDEQFKQCWELIQNFRNSATLPIHRYDKEETKALH